MLTLLAHCVFLTATVVNRHRSMTEATCRTTPLSLIFLSGSAVDLILDRIGSMQADTRESIEAIGLHVNRGAVGTV